MGCETISLMGYVQIGGRKGGISVIKISDLMGVSTVI